MRFDPGRRRYIKSGAIAAISLITGVPTSEGSSGYSLRLAQSVAACGELGPVYYLHFQAPVMQAGEVERWREALVREFQLGTIASESVLGATGSDMLRCLRFRDGAQLDMQHGVNRAADPIVLTVRGKLAVATFTI